MEFFTADFWKGIFTDLTEYLDDWPIQALKGILNAVLSVFNTVVPPDFLHTYALGETLGPVMQYIGFFLAQAGLSQAMGVIAAAVVFRVVRKAVTFGLW
jgi:hypothetical protein